MARAKKDSILDTLHIIYEWVKRDKFGNYMVRNNGLLGVVSSTGEQIIPVEYTNIVTSLKCYKAFTPNCISSIPTNGIDSTPIGLKAYDRYNCSEIRKINSCTGLYDIKGCKLYSIDGKEVSKVNKWVSMSNIGDNGICLIDENSPKVGLYSVKHQELRIYDNVDSYRILYDSAVELIFKVTDENKDWDKPNGLFSTHLDDYRIMVVDLDFNEYYTEDAIYKHLNCVECNPVDNDGNIIEDTLDIGKMVSVGKFYEGKKITRADPNANNAVLLKDPHNWQLLDHWHYIFGRVPMEEISDMEFRDFQDLVIRLGGDPLKTYCLGGFSENRIWFNVDLGIRTTQSPQVT